MLASSTLLDSPTGAALRLHRFLPEGEARAVLLILHGLAEHSGRYARLGRELAELGIAVYAHDHRGHGSTTALDAPLRRFGGRNGAAKVLRDVQAVRHQAEADCPGKPVVVLGHSMGAYIALNHARTFGEGLAGLALWNASFERGWSERLGTVAFKAEKALKGSDVASALFARATFDVWSRSVQPRRTPFDWLTHDESEVDRYIADPLCGWTPTISMVEDILNWQSAGASVTPLGDLPHRLPIHCLGGSEDPATAKGAAVRSLAARLEQAGSLDVHCHVVQGARHEVLLEIEPMRSEAVEQLHAFIDRCLLPSGQRRQKIA
ncbi:alpha/beta fold hydrolase [Aureimonas sp. D3]|uniref:alpha/beta fold hydrolase n=1 Tax=Aureimonas sp. D3 TaxID=1638164 RepID=UPI000780A449|nr:alpha/beta hydrolase [Aureimonas sp. D3]